METLNRRNISYQEMDELIELAEKVYENIETLKGKIKKEQTPLALYIFSIIITAIMMFAIFSPLLNENSSLKVLIGFALLIILFVPTFITLQETNKLKNAINREQKVLQKLLNMIEGYKDLYIENEYGNESSVLSKALFEMRLSRINFDVK